MLLVATAAWAVSFSLNKDAGDRLNQLAGAAPGGFFGPVAFQGFRFLMAGVLWFVCVPAARRGWTVAGVCRGLYVGTLLAAGIILQHLGLDLVTPATAAFLTSLTVLWVPLISTVIARRLPHTGLLVSAALAAVGLYLMTGEGLRTFRRGEMLLLACSVVFSFHLLAVSRTVRAERQAAPGGEWRMCGAQFVLTGLLCLMCALLAHPLPPAATARLVLAPDIAGPLAVVLIFPTLIAFGLMNRYQHQVDATRAVLIYQAEAIVAAGFDWLYTGRGLSTLQLLGAALLVTANILAELRPVPPQDADATE